MRQQPLIAAIAVLCALASATPSTHLYRSADLVAVRAAIRGGSADARTVRSLGSLLRAADRLLVPPPNGSSWSFSTGPWSVMNKTIAPPSGASRHDYVSIGIYNHPCNALPDGCTPYPGGHLLPPSQCDNASGLPWEPCDGQRNQGAIDEGDAPRQGAMQGAVIKLAAAAYFCNATATARDDDCAAPYARRAAQVLDVWFLRNATAMHPNLSYGQIDPKAADVPVRPGHGGFIEWAHTAELLDAVLLLRAADPAGVWWSAAQHAAFVGWVRAFEGYVEGKAAQGERRMTNNHASWYDATWQAVALFAGNATAAAIGAAEVATERIAKQILPNGTQWIELQRHEPSGYCQYNLVALSQDAELSRNGKASGVDIWGFQTADGRSLRKAIDYMLPFAAGWAPWPYPQPEAPSWAEMSSVLRRAANAFQNRTYEEARCFVVGGADKDKSMLNLMMPPHFADVTC